MAISNYAYFNDDLSPALRTALRLTLKLKIYDSRFTIHDLRCTIYASRLENRVYDLGIGSRVL